VRTVVPLWKGPLSLVKKVRRTLKRFPQVKRAFNALRGGVLRLLEGAIGFHTPPTDHDYAFRFALLLRYWEPETVAHVRQVLKRGDVAVDVGAHVGYYTRLFSELVGPEGLVVAVEPDPLNMSFLRRNLRGNQVCFFPVAVGREEGEADLYVPPFSNSGMKSLGQIPEALLQGRVAVRPLSALLTEAGVGERRVRLLKLDVEGAEKDALESLGPWASRVDQVVCELNAVTQRAFGYGPPDLVKLLLERGYSAFTFLDPTSIKGEDPIPLPSSFRKGWMGKEEIQEVLEILDPWPEDLLVNLAARRA
jgi:FkbM family methyltransferase